MKYIDFLRRPIVAMFSSVCAFLVPHKSFFSRVNIFIHYHDAAITLTPHTKLTREAEKDRLLLQLAPAKTNSLTSERGVLLDWICLPACLCQSQTETKGGKGRKIWKERPGKLCSARCSLATEERQKERARGFKAKRSSLLSFHLIFLHYPVHLHGRYIVRSFKAEGEGTYCGFQIPRLPGGKLNEQNPKKSHLLKTTKTKRIPSQPVFY